MQLGCSFYKRHIFHSSEKGDPEVRRDPVKTSLNNWVSERPNILGDMAAMVSYRGKISVKVSNVGGMNGERDRP